MKKKLTVFLVMILAIVMIVGCSSGNNAGGSGNNAGGSSNSGGAKTDTIHVKLGHTLSEESSWQVLAEEFAKQIEEKTDGRYVVDIFANAQLSSGDQQKALEMLRQGSYDVDITSALIWSNLDPDINITAMPWILPNTDIADEKLQGEAGQLLMDIIKENGVTPVAIGETGYRQMLNNVHQIKSPEDLKNLKMRVPGTKMFLDLYDILGADPTAMNFTEVFTALQQNTIDGMEGVVDVMVANRFFEVLDYMSVNNYNYDIFYLTFSNQFFDGLSEEDKQIFLEAGKAATKVSTDYARNANKESLELLKQEMEVYEPTAEEIDAFREAAFPIYEQYKDTFSPELREAFDYPE